MNNRSTILPELLSRTQTKITLIVGPPRSVSTAISLALSQSPDIHCLIHEPFSNDYSGVPISDKKMKGGELARYLQKNSGRHVLIKESSNHLSDSLFRELLPFCTNILLIVRSPLLQLTSLIKMWKWIWASCPEGYLDEELNIKARDIRKLSKNDDLDYYFSGAWRSLKKFAEIFFEVKQNNNVMIDKLIVLDAEISRAVPRETFSRLAREMKVRFSPRMLSGWLKEASCNLKTDEWSSRSSTSNRLFYPDRDFCGFRGLPGSWRKMIRKAYHDYCDILAAGPFSIQRTLKSFVRLIGMPLGSKLKLLDTAPDTCYALIEHLNVSPKAKFRLREAIKAKCFQHIEVFSMIDEICQNNQYWGRIAKKQNLD